MARAAVQIRAPREIRFVLACRRCPLFRQTRDACLGMTCAVARCGRALQAYESACEFDRSRNLLRPTLFLFPVSCRSPSKWGYRTPTLLPFCPPTTTSFMTNATTVNRVPSFCATLSAPGFSRASMLQTEQNRFLLELPASSHASLASVIGPGACSMHHRLCRRGSADERARVDAQDARCLR